MPTCMRLGYAKAAMRQLKGLYQRGADLRESNAKLAGISLRGIFIPPTKKLLKLSRSALMLPDMTGV